MGGREEVAAWLRRRRSSISRRRASREASSLVVRSTFCFLDVCVRFMFCVEEREGER